MSLQILIFRYPSSQEKTIDSDKTEGSLFHFPGETGLDTKQKTEKATTSALHVKVQFFLVSVTEGRNTT